MKLRVLALALAILAFFIFVGSPFQQAAQALVIESGALIAIIISALAAMGITFITTGAFDSLEDYVGSLFNDYCANRNMTFEEATSGIQVGSTSLGKLVINNRFVQLIQGFAAYVKALLGLQNNDYQVIQREGSSIGSIAVNLLPLFVIRDENGNERLCKLSWYYVENGEHITPDDVYVALLDKSGNNDAFTVALVSRTSYSNLTMEYIALDNGANLGTGNASLTGHYLSSFYVANWYIQRLAIAFTRTLNPTPSYTYSEIAQALNSSTNADYNNIGIYIDTHDIVLPDDDDRYTVGDGAIIDVGADWGDSYGEIVDDTIPDAFSDGKTADTSITYEDEEAATEQVEDTPAQSVSQSANDYQVNGLTTVFPFCIPFDLYNFVACLAADPVAPSFTWRFYVPGICDESIEIDLSEFNAAAQILRTMELLLFCVGLAFVTRKIIRG